MAGVEDKPDLTVQLPDELLCHVFSFLSLSDKLRSEVVSRKYQRCVLEELKANPLRLEFDLDYHGVNGYDMRPQRTIGVLRNLAKRAKFSSIRICVSSGDFDQFWLGSSLSLPERTDRMDAILTVLLSSENQCLSKMTEFATDSSASQAVMQNFLDKCDKISTIKFGFNILPLGGTDENNCNVFPLDLCQLFKNKGFTELKLKPYKYHQEGLTDMYRMIKPNTLRKVNLDFIRMPELNVVELVKAIGPIGSALEEIDLEFRKGHGQLSEMFELLAQLPALRNVDIYCDTFEPNNQFVSAVISLFNMSGTSVTVRARGSSFFIQPFGCELVNMIRQIQNVHPSLVVDLFSRRRRVTLTLGNATIHKPFFAAIEDCGAEDCLQCHSFYLSVLCFLRLRAEHALFNYVEAQHFPQWQLDKCRFGQILEDLEFDVDENEQKRLRPLSLEVNQDQQSVTINFESTWMQQEHHLFNITIGCGQCLTNGCMECEN